MSHIDSILSNDGDVPPPDRPLSVELANCATSNIMIRGNSISAVSSKWPYDSPKVQGGAAPIGEVSFVNSMRAHAWLRSVHLATATLASLAAASGHANAKERRGYRVIEAIESRAAGQHRPFRRCAWWKAEAESRRPATAYRGKPGQRPG
jgi:hypothetical protein